MKILQLVNRVPYPLNDGGNIAVYDISKGFLEAGVDLSMLAMNTSRHQVDLRRLPDFFKAFTHFETIPVDNRIKFIPAFLNLFQRSSYNIDRFISDEYAQKLEVMLQEEAYDIIQLEGLFLAPYLPVIRKNSQAKIVIRQHNVEFQIWERMAAGERNFLKSAYYRLLAKRLKRFEIKHLNDYDLIVPISKPDQLTLEQLGAKKPLVLQPFGIDTAEVPFLPEVDAPISLYHIGAMDWLPNLEGVLYFLEKVMPLLKASAPGLKLYLAGRNMSETVAAYADEQVIIAGEVPDATVFEKDKSILIVPLQSGGGVRIKIFQAMAMGKAIVTTSVGMEGIEAENGKHLLVADTPEAFAEHLINMYRQPERIRELGKNARALISEKYERKKLIGQLLDRYRELIYFFPT